MARKNEEAVNHGREKQGELFGEFKTAKAKKGGPYFRRDMMSGKKVSLSLSYETIILLFIAFIMLLVVFFSLGVEKGKAIKSQNAKVLKTEVPKVSEEILQGEAEEAEITAPVIEPADEPVIKAAPAPRPYTIQVASFKKGPDAEKEIERLKKAGYNAFSISSDKWVQVCVGRYANRKESEKDFGTLKEKYPTCYFRKTGE